MDSNIRTARKDCSLTQKNILDELGIPIRTQTSWENGDRKPAEWLEQMVIREYKRIAKS